MSADSIVVLVGVVSADGRTVRVAPGVEVGCAAVYPFAEVPRTAPAGVDGTPVPLLLFFGTEVERAAFAAEFEGASVPL